jgi:hypothetical protein
VSTVKVAISATIEVDVEGWDMDYGTGTEAPAIREDVKRYLHSLIHECNGNMTVVKWK